MLIERSNIDYPLWRKKVDASFLTTADTPIPNWLLDLWSIKKLFNNVRSKNDNNSNILILFQKSEYEGHIAKIKYSGSSYRYRIYFSQDLMHKLREVYLMTYMRTLEGKLRKLDKNKNIDVEREISFWEFIDIEFNAKKRVLILTDHYKQKPTFPELFKHLAGSPALKNIDDKINNNEKVKIHKNNWKNREHYKKEIDAENIIYILADTKNKLLYVGEAKKLISRFNSGHKEIPNWDFYKYNLLPKEYDYHRLTIERMIIRDFAAILDNNQGINTLSISEYKLANKKIDK